MLEAWNLESGTVNLRSSRQTRGLLGRLYGFHFCHHILQVFLSIFGFDLCFVSSELISELTVSTRASHLSYFDSHSCMDSCEAWDDVQNLKQWVRSELPVEPV